MILLVVLGIPTTLAAIALRMTDRGTVLFRQRRVGKDGRPFEILKLRTMKQDAHLMGPAWTEVDDPRVTPVGRVIRKTYLDEVPQLINVLRGEMSLVGPRPESESLSHLYANRIPGYALRHSVKPGLTGWAQVEYRSTCSIEDAAVKLRYDLHYVGNRSPFLDLRILAKTVLVVLFRPDNH